MGSERLEGRGGPLVPLRITHVEQIAEVAERAADCVERAVDLSRDALPIDQPCLHCRWLLLLWRVTFVGVVYRRPLGDLFFEAMR